MPKGKMEGQGVGKQWRERRQTVVISQFQTVSNKMVTILYSRDVKTLVLALQGFCFILFLFISSALADMINQLQPTVNAHTTSKSFSPHKTPVVTTN